MILRKISSPSRPASHALMSASTSFRLSKRLSTLSRPTFLSIGASANSGGSDGRFSIFHFPRAGSKPSGGASSSRWPTADEMTHWSFSYQSPSFFTPSAFARSVATLGFSAMTRVFGMRQVLLELYEMLTWECFDAPFHFEGEQGRRHYLGWQTGFCHEVVEAGLALFQTI